MLANFLNGRSLREDFDLSYSYRHSDLYQEGLEKRIRAPHKPIPLKLLSPESFISGPSILLNKKLKTFIFHIFLLKYIFLVQNFIVLFPLFKKIKPDILHINNGGYPGAYSCQAAVIAAKAAKIPHIIYVVNNIATSYRYPSRWVDYPLDKAVAKFVSLFITGSIFAKVQLSQTINIPQNKITNIPNGIQVRQVSLNKKQVMQELGIPSDAIVIGIIAVLEKRKGHLILLEAFKRALSATDQKIILLIEGDGPEKGEIIHQIEKLGLSKNVLQIDRFHEIFSLINAIDILTLPSLYNEDFPNIILEAMSLGKPVIATTIAGIPEQITDGKNGLLVPPANIDSLFEALHCLIKSEQERGRMGQNGKEMFERHFVAEVAVERYKYLYKDLRGTK